MDINREDIKIKRKEKKMTQSELAEKLDINPKYLSDIETGRVKPSKKLENKIIKVLKLEKKNKKEIIENECPDDAEKSYIAMKMLLERDAKIYSKLYLKKSFDEYNKKLLEKIDTNFQELYYRYMTLLEKKQKKKSDIYTGNDLVRMNSLKNDFLTTNRIIYILFEYKEKLNEYHSELMLLLATNNEKSNVKITKGLKELIRNLQKNSHEIEPYLGQREIEIMEEE